MSASTAPAPRAPHPPLDRTLRPGLAAFQAPVLWTSVWQIVSTASLYMALLAAMYALPAWCGVFLAIPAGGLLVRLFIIQHDCGHGSFFQSRRANDMLGWCCSLLTVTPYANWRFQHAHHHATWNNLDRRTGWSDIYSNCLTVAEYRALSPFRRLVHRVTLHPIVAQLLLPPIVFLILFRWPFDTPMRTNKERFSVLRTNLALIAVYGGLALWLGVLPVLLVQGSTIAVASIIGVWMFSIQHRFEDAVWARQEKWNAPEAALLGSSFLRLPAVLQWFTGSIGYHHLHHLAPRIPNYRLEACQHAFASLLPTDNALTIRQALGAARYTLWDETTGRMVRFRDAA